jgi:SAM-dependent methyltransferase
MKRVHEEELMDVPLNAQAYAEADFSEPNAKFVDYFSSKFPGFNGQQIIDLGCGPADIAIRLAIRYPQARVVGVDAMLDRAREVILRHTALANRVEVRRWHIGREVYPFGSETFHAVVSNSLLHHMRNPLDFWGVIRERASPGAAVLVMDLIRPQSRIDAENIVEKYSASEPEVLRVDFLNSLLAAYRPDEIATQLVSANMDSLHIEVISDRHFIVFGLLRE